MPNIHDTSLSTMLAKQHKNICFILYWLQHIINVNILSTRRHNLQSSYNLNCCSFSTGCIWISAIKAMTDQAENYLVIRNWIHLIADLLCLQANEASAFRTFMFFQFQKMDYSSCSTLQIVQHSLHYFFSKEVHFLVKLNFRT